MLIKMPMFKILFYGADRSSRSVNFCSFICSSYRLNLQLLTSDSTQRKLFIAVRALREQSSISIVIIVLQSEPRILCLVIVMIHVTPRDFWGYSQNECEPKELSQQKGTQELKAESQS